MLDLETMSIADDAAITEIAAVEFDPTTGKLGREFHIGVDLQSCIDAGLSISASTIIDFWLQQSQEARESLKVSQDGAFSLREALIEFEIWLGTDKFVWGNGSLSDNLWMKNAYKAAGLECPIEFWAHMDVRTAVNMGRTITGKDFKQDLEFDGVPHNPLDDCKFQIRYVHEYYKTLLCKVP